MVTTSRFLFRFLRTIFGPPSLEGIQNKLSQRDQKWNQSEAGCDAFELENFTTISIR